MAAAATSATMIFFTSLVATTSYFAFGTCSTSLLSYCCFDNLQQLAAAESGEWRAAHHITSLPWSNSTSHTPTHSRRHYLGLLGVHVLSRSSSHCSGPDCGVMGTQTGQPVLCGPPVHGVRHAALRPAGHNRDLKLRTPQRSIPSQPQPEVPSIPPSLQRPMLLWTRVGPRNVVT